MDKFESLENEIWVDAKSFTTDYSGHYIVSNMGRCWSFKSNKFLGGWYKGYYCVSLCKEKHSEMIMVGRLMLISFGVPIPEHLKDLPTSKLQAMHLDGDRHNNHLDNFAWGNHLENCNEINHRIRRSEAMKGFKNPNYGKPLSSSTKRKLSERFSKPILQYTMDGQFIKEWCSQSEVARELDIDQGSISACARGKKKSCGGYVWKYKPI